jgi:hypothetical protein
MPLAALIIEVLLAKGGTQDVIRVLMQQQPTTRLTVTEQVVTPVGSTENA